MSRSSDRHRRLRAVFDEALLQEPSARAAYVEHACASDSALGSEVLRLLAAHEEAPLFLEHPPERLLSAVRAEERFCGTGRFRVVRRLGAGGMGVVYEAHDGVRDEVVALKTLLRTGAADLYRLKREFRSLADVTHANLVCLYELFVEDDQCFFTMELVEGVSFVDYVRGTDRTHRFDDRLVHALRQLVDGVSALHTLGKLHRDIKPSNVIVTSEGRVVILDFGLTSDVPAANAGGSEIMAGTPAYIAPELYWGPFRRKPTIGTALASPCTKRSRGACLSMVLRTTCSAARRNSIRRLRLRSRRTSRKTSALSAWGCCAAIRSADCPAATFFVSSPEAKSWRASRPVQRCAAASRCLSAANDSWTC